MDRALLTLCAMLLNAAFGGILPLLTRMPARALREVERKFNREQRTSSERELRGIMLVLGAILASIFAGLFCSWLCRDNLQFLEIIILALALPLRSSFDLVSRMRKRLVASDLTGARQLLDSALWRHQAVLDEYGVARAGIETLAVHFSEKIFAPIFWYMLFGLPGLFVTKSITLLQETLMLPSPSEPSFAKASNLAHELWHYIPSRLAAILWALSTIFLPAGYNPAAMRQVIAGMNATAQTLALTAAAAALKLALGGPTSIYVRDAWVGGGSQKLIPSDMRRGLYLFALLNLALFILLGFGLFW